MITLTVARNRALTFVCFHPTSRCFQEVGSQPSHWDPQKPDQSGPAAGMCVFVWSHVMFSSKCQHINMFTNCNPSPYHVCVKLRRTGLMPCACRAEHGGPRRGGRRPGGRDERRVREIRQSGEMCHFWGESRRSWACDVNVWSHGLNQTYLSSQIADVLDDEAVRIFLEFERVESAIKGQCVHMEHYGDKKQPILSQRLITEPHLLSLIRIAFLNIKHLYFVFLFFTAKLYIIATSSSSCCISALIMWVKMCPLLNGLAQISNQVRLGPLRCYITHGPATQPSPGGTALTSELSKAGQTIKEQYGGLQSVSPPHYF